MGRIESGMTSSSKSSRSSDPFKSESRLDPVNPVKRIKSTPSSHVANPLRFIGLNSHHSVQRKNQSLCNVFQSIYTPRPSLAHKEHIPYAAGCELPGQRRELRLVIIYIQWS